MFDIDLASGILIKLVSFVGSWTSQNPLCRWYERKRVDECPFMMDNYAWCESSYWQYKSWGDNFQGKHIHVWLVQQNAFVGVNCFRVYVSFRWYNHSLHKTISRFIWIYTKNVFHRFIILMMMIHRPSYVRKSIRQQPLVQGQTFYRTLLISALSFWIKHHIAKYEIVFVVLILALYQNVSPKNFEIVLIKHQMLNVIFNHRDSLQIVTTGQSCDKLPMEWITLINALISKGNLSPASKLH